MSQTSPNSWWRRATTEQRLAQLDGAIELGMTAAQLALNCGSNAANCHVFASRHNRSFPSRGTSASHARAMSVRATRKAFLAGDVVDLWAAQ